MGMGQSARKLTISNEEDLDVIKVSHAVVQRLQGAKTEIGGRDEQPRQPSTLTSPISAVPVQGGPPSGATVYHHPEYTISAFEIQQQKEEKLKNLDRYWQRRLHELEKNYQKIDYVLEAEYKKAIQEFSNGKQPISKDTRPPCMENSSKVLKCYQENPRETLKCSDLVQEFSNCVDQRRSNLIAARC